VEAIEVSDGQIRDPSGHSVAFAKFVASTGVIVASGTFANTKRTYTYGAHAAHVAIDHRTGHVEVIDYLAVEDVGRAVNPAIVHGQAIGAVVQGLGGVFLDHLIYDENAQLQNASFADYLLPLATDFPNVRGVTLELRRSATNPLGAKGAGEGGIVSVAATIGNAVAAALVKFRAEPKELPLTPATIWALIEQSGSGALDAP
jgi:carbon-monoxide dehydrogenase large subunit